MTNRSKDNISTSAGGSDAFKRTDLSWQVRQSYVDSVIVPQLSHISMPSEEETYHLLSGVVPVSGLIWFMGTSQFHLR